ncbi:uncharacterized protein [Rutidosis leptorrhynchoides]|uniref:uncharacterized protein n=1 Tax=Rutidosis leptorrhynchoides TaxID=125765 RepID=UPI003A991EC6
MGEENAITLINKLDFGDPLYLHPIGFVDGTCVKNANDEVLSKQWDRCNSVVLSWLLGSIADELYAGLIFSENASTVWTEQKETYDKIDGSIIFNLHFNISTLKQGNSSMSEYYHKLNSLWKQYDAMANLKQCTCEVADQTVKHNSMLKLMQFLMGLNYCYMHVKSNLLLRDPLPDVKTAYSMLSREESHRGLSTTDNKPQTSVFMSQVESNVSTSNNVVNDNNVQRRSNQNNFSSGNNSNNFTNNRTLNSNYKCTKCNKIGHTIDRCYKIVGYPPGWKEKIYVNKFNSKNAANHSSVSDSSGSGSGNNNLTNEQMMKLLSLINEKSGPEIATENIAGTVLSNSKKFNENFHKIFNPKTNLSKTENKGWIIDFGASQHMSESDNGLNNIIDVSHLNFSTHVWDLRLGIIVGTGDVFDGLYVFNVSSHENDNTYLSANKCYLSNNLWHNRLGHPSENVLKKLKGKIDLSNKDINCEPCDVCHKAKQTRETFNDSDHKSVAVGDLVHINLWGPFRVQSREGFKYFLTIIDDYSRAVWTYLIKSKDEVFSHIKSFVFFLETQFESKVKIIRPDNGTEFVNNQMDDFIKDKGILHQTSCVYTPQQNGIVERKHRHLLNVSRALMFQGGLPLNMWSDCILTTCYLINRTPSSILSGCSPYELLFKKSPKICGVVVCVMLLIKTC